MSIDKGQLEAGSSLGLNYPRTMIYIIIPQAFKNVLPALANECIVLLKETSVAGYIAIEDLTKGGDIIRSITYDAIYAAYRRCSDLPCYGNDTFVACFQNLKGGLAEE